MERVTGREAGARVVQLQGGARGAEAVPVLVGEAAEGPRGAARQQQQLLLLLRHVATLLVRAQQQAPMPMCLIMAATKTQTQQ